MEPGFLTALIQRPAPPRKDEITELEKILDRHPYFQLGLAIKARYLQANRHISYLKETRKTATAFPNRSQLHAFFHPEMPATPEKKTAQKIEGEETRLPDPTEPKKEAGAVPDRTPEDALLEQQYLAEAINRSIQLDPAIIAETDTKEEHPSPAGQAGESGILSFPEWLRGKKEPDAGPKQAELIAKFIREEPMISPPVKKEFYSPAEKGKESISADNIPVSETLIRIFEAQGNKEMAIKGYKKLMLKYPEKSSYFAGLIEKLKEK